MALSKDKKAEIVSDISGLLSSSKMTVVAKYQGTSVKSLQELRKKAEEDGTKIQVIKNRLFKIALKEADKFKEVDSGVLTGQLLYAFNSSDEVAPAQVLANFAKVESQLEFVGALSQDGQFIPAEDVKALANLPGKEQLRAQLAGTIAAPLSGFTRVLSGNLRGFVNILSAKAQQ